MTAQPDPSAFDRLVARVVAVHGSEEAFRLIRAEISSWTNTERAAFAHLWRVWGRPKQLAPSGPWRRWGFLTGRAFGKTFATSNYINGAVARGEAKLICLIAQDEVSACNIQVHGPSGLIATAHPQHRPQWQAHHLQLLWPNGSRAYVCTPEVPGKIRGLEYHLAFASELQSWPTATRYEAWSNLNLSVRLGASRIVWDATPKRRHPILRELLADAERDPERYPVVRGSTHENAANLGGGFVEELERQIGGTLKGREELLGEMLTESEDALVKQDWIDRVRRARPDHFVRRVIGVDPAVTSRGGSDLTGIVVAGLGADEQAYVLADRSGKYAPPEWAKLVLDVYLEEECDVVLAETNKGGELIVGNLRAAAHQRGLRIVEIGRDERPRRTAGVINVKPLYSQGAKEDRAQPVATAYERGRVSHVRGADLSNLEDTLTTWEPGGKVEASRGTRVSRSGGNKSPDDLDALTFAVVELLAFTDNKPNGRAGMVGIGAAQQVLTRPAQTTGVAQSINRLLGGGNGGGRI